MQKVLYDTTCRSYSLLIEYYENPFHRFEIIIAIHYDALNLKLEFVHRNRLFGAILTYYVV